jgi:AraC-like DNA-binding protein
MADYPAIDGECGVKFLGYHWRVGRQWYPHRPKGDRGYYFLLAETELKIRTDGLLRTYPKHSFIVFAPGTHIHFGHNIPWSHSLVGVGGRFVHSLIREHAIPCNSVVTLHNPEPFYECIFGCYKEVMRQGAPDGEILISYLCIFVTKLHRLLLTEHDTGIPGKFVQAKRYVDEHFRETIGIGELAARYGYSEPYFITCFSRHFAVSPAAYIIRKRMDAAAVSLLNLDLKVKEIAASVGIENFHYFSRLFKKTFGVSPMGYRRNAFEGRTT